MNAQQFTRGIGVYPGNRDEDYSPVLIAGDTSYRNLALFRPVYQSSSYDYNLTAQLVTDGIVDLSLPPWLSVFSSQQGILQKNERQRILDRHRMTSVTIDSSFGWIQLNLEGGSKGLITDSLNLTGSLLIDDREPLGWECRILGSIDGIHWEIIDKMGGMGYPGDSIPKEFRRWAPVNMRVFIFPASAEKKATFKRFRAEFNAPNVTTWKITEFEFFEDNVKKNIGGPYEFSSAWMSTGNEEEWIMIDLGSLCTFDHIVMHWIRKAQRGIIQISTDGNTWEDIKSLPAEDDLYLDKPEKASYVRILMYKSVSAEGYLISEVEIYGRGGVMVNPKSVLMLPNDTRFQLSGGNWKIQRSPQCNADGETLSKPGFDDSAWLKATVPATVLVSYLNAGALADPNFSDNQLLISDSYFYSDFWYRNEFKVPESYEGERTWLNFDGINWKAHVFLNGTMLGNIEGAFERGQFDVTSILQKGKENVIAVQIEKNATPGYPKKHTWESPDANGGELGGDNPTFHASVGWDWIPSIRGRNTGIWNDVYFSRTGSVTLHNPFITSDLPLPDTSYADLTLEVELQNHSSKVINGKLQCTIGSNSFEQQVELNALSTKSIKLDPSLKKALRIKNPLLWWPNGYGEQHLYDVELKFVTSGKQVSDQKSFKIGIREMTYSEDNGMLRIWVNGVRFIGRGGNWGFPESMLQYRGREYEIAVRYHKEMNFTMIRNWVGQTSDDEFFEACDRNGIMVWQDFWLANPVDGPDPFNNSMFMKNAEDFVERIRNHPSIALYCGRNEGYPPEDLDKNLRKLLPEIHPGIHYISNSAWDVVSGGGPYRAQTSKYYFEERATPKFHSEMGRPCIVPFESLEKMMPDSSLQHLGQIWGVHDFCLNGAQRASSFIRQMDESFGTIENMKEWVALAQWLNYDGYRAMFEAQSKYRMGLLLWMSHPAWPSLVWQTYDYYFEPTGAYFGCKKASEPLHIQWNPLTDSIEVVNYNHRNVKNLKALMEVFNLEGSLLYSKSTDIDISIDDRISCFNVDYPAVLTEVYFIRLKLMQGGKIISENIYWRGKEEDNLKAIRDIRKVTIRCTTQIEQRNDKWFLTTTILNPDNYPALLLRLKVVKEKSLERILPVIYSDNYLTLMPQEVRIIEIELKHEDTNGEKPLVVIEGLNLH
jgi:hypothetical protein